MNTLALILYLLGSRDIESRLQWQKAIYSQTILNIRMKEFSDYFHDLNVKMGRYKTEEVK